MRRNRSTLMRVPTARLVSRTRRGEGVVNTATDRTYSTTEVSDMLGVSFRMIDYWLRQGYVTIEHDAVGSGHHRRWTDDEVAALRRCVTAMADARDVLDSFAAGDLWHAERRRVSQ